MTSKNKTKIQTSGHLFNYCSDAANIELSRKRAEAVKQTLTCKHNIDQSSLGSDGKGKTASVEVNNTKEGKAQTGEWNL